MGLYETQWEAMEAALEEMRDDPDRGLLFACMGPPRCCGTDPEHLPCPFCWIVDPDDRRPLEEILAEQVN